MSILFQNRWECFRNLKRISSFTFIRSNIRLPEWLSVHLKLCFYEAFDPIIWLKALIAVKSQILIWIFESLNWCLISIVIAVCNITLDAAELRESSKLRYGQIKSMEIRDNQICWYRLVPERGYRVELQIYRLVDMGHLHQNR